MLLEVHVGRPRDEGIRQAEGDLREGVGGAGHHGHAPRTTRAARDGSAQVGVRIDRGGALQERFRLHSELFAYHGRRAGRQDDDVLHVRRAERLQHPGRDRRSARARDADDVGTLLCQFRFPRLYSAQEFA